MAKNKKIMNYELAKKLKDAGFPQTFSYRPRMCDEVYFDGGVIGLRQEGKEYIYIPTLSELIEACGDGFGYLVRFPDGTKWRVEKNRKWEAIGYPKSYDCNKTSFYKKTPEEAVANLWLELNKK